MWGWGAGGSVVTCEDAPVICSRRPEISEALMVRVRRGDIVRGEWGVGSEGEVLWWW